MCYRYSVITDSRYPVAVCSEVRPWNSVIALFRHSTLTPSQEPQDKSALGGSKPEPEPAFKPIFRKVYQILLMPIH